MSVFLKRTGFPEVNISHEQALLYLSRGNISPGNIQKGWNMVSYKGVILGFINNIGKRINNYYPPEWRIRMNINKSGQQQDLTWEKKN
jgi:NOL1/NOP2/fmu family ribosome biogenesis protein